MFIFFKYFAEFFRYFQWFIGDQGTAIVSTTIAKKVWLWLVFISTNKIFRLIFFASGSDE